MKPGKRLDFRSEVERLLSEVRTGSMMNEVPLLDTGIKVYIFKVGEKTFFSMYSIIDIFQYFGNVEDPMSICEYLKSINCVEKLGELGESFENRDLEVVCSDFITNEVFMAFQKRISDSKQRDEEMKIYFNQMDMEQLPDSVFNLDEYGLDLSSKPRESLENSHSINGLYPFNGQWTDSIMDGILKNIYTSDEHNMGVNNTSKTCLDVNRVSGRGRHVKPSGNLKDRPFVCTYKDCKRAFKRYEHLKRHNLMHTGERPHKCKFPGCSKAFSRSDNLSQHYKIHNVADSMHTKTYESYRYLNKEFN